jgi:hypothetical protein
MTREDLPEPETPVKQVNTPRGMRTSTAQIVGAGTFDFEPALTVRRSGGIMIWRRPAR